MALHDREQYELDREDGLVREVPAVVLLTRLYKEWPSDADFWPTLEMISVLVSQHPNVWGAEGPFRKRLTPQRLGRMLAKSYKINSTRQDNHGPRGYHHSAFVRVWSRMQIVPGKPAKPAKPDQSEPVRPEKPDKPVSGGG